jgi:hypothetical protein
MSTFIGTTSAGKVRPAEYRRRTSEQVFWGRAAII